MDNIFAYLRSRWQLLLFYGIVLAILLLTAFLGNQDMGLALYAAAMLTFMLVLLLLAEGSRFCGRLRLLQRLLQRLGALPSGLPRPDGAMEAAYGALIEELSQQGAALRRALEKNQADSLAYYTLWVHQIKTPIAAMELVLRQDTSTQAEVLRQELFKIQRYVELALQYNKLQDLASDLVITPCDLAAILRECVKKYALLFIHQGLSVEIGPLAETVVSDKKWLSFLLEQIISNGAKYTHTGGMRIYMEGERLVLEDTGIGIRPEDLPRIFERGYTGYNGRLDSRASGIGLYMAKRVADALGIALLPGGEHVLCRKLDRGPRRRNRPAHVCHGDRCVHHFRLLLPAVYQPLPHQAAEKGIRPVWGIGAFQGPRRPYRMGKRHGAAGGPMPGAGVCPDVRQAALFGPAQAYAQPPQPGFLPLAFGIPCGDRAVPGGVRMHLPV